jgi:pyruvate,water dikinase
MTVTVYKCPDGTDFPVEWENPEDEKRGWFWDQMHCPLPLTPLSASLWHDIGNGFNDTGNLIGMPGFGVRLNIHGFAFIRQQPYADDQGLRERIRAKDAAEREPNLLTFWRERYEPECRALTRAIRGLAADVTSLEAGLDLFGQVHAARRRLGQIHMLAMGLATQISSRFIDRCKTRFGAEGELIATDLMGGFPNRSLDSAKGLWELGELVRQLPSIEKLMRTESAGGFLESLKKTEGGSEFRDRLDAYLDEFGHRNESFSELSFPTWAEEPKFPLLMVRRFLDQPSESSPSEMHRRTERRREERLAAVKASFGADEEGWREFEGEMLVAQQRTVLIEDHNFYIDQQGPAASRRFCLAIAGRLVERGLIDDRDEAFYVTKEDIAAIARGDSLDLRRSVKARRVERERWLRVLPPASIGAGEVAMAPFMQRFFGPVSNEPMGEGAFRGVAGSPGVVRATARLVLGLDDIDRLAPGEILVTYATAPPWTPAFAIAGGIVTDIGGTLSHCAVVAREYGIPAVVGTRIATATIQDGALITVDGTNGVVRLEG